MSEKKITIVVRKSPLLEAYVFVDEKSYKERISRDGRTTFYEGITTRDCDIGSGLILKKGAMVEKVDRRLFIEFAPQGFDTCDEEDVENYEIKLG